MVRMNFGETLVYWYLRFNGFFPLPPWGGFAVLCAYSVAALGLAIVLLRRRDA